MVDKYIRYTGFVLGSLENIFRDKVTVSGEENIPKDNPIMFTSNHFTRLETLLLPYFCNKVTGKMARSLADKNLFSGKGGFTEYLERTGTLSTDNPNRDQIIVSDLLTGENNWIIYPEGNMMKNKKVTFERGRFYLHLKDKVREMFTGSAVLAIESQLLRHDAKVDQKKYFLEGKKVSDRPTAIVPVNISYYPIRPGANKLQYWIGKFVKNVSARMGEEMDIETNILAEANMHIHFCKPIYVDEFISKSKFIADKIPFVPAAKKKEFIINYYRHRLTTAFMYSVYHHVAINLDHIFSLTLYLYPKDEIHIKELISRVYLNIKELQQLPNYYFHPSVKINVFKVLAGKEYPPLKSIFELARAEGIVVGGDEYEYLQINRASFNNEYEFHNIRLKNVMKILVNEMLLLDDVKNIVESNAVKADAEVSKEIFSILLKRDVENFEKDYEKYKSDHSKPHDFGKPFFLKAPTNKIGVILSHGYKASPEEVRPLAEYLNAHGCNVYVIRMHGHGTSAENLMNTSWLKWYDSYMRGVVALDQICEKVIFAGFSTGGLLSLYAAAKHPDICQGVISISAAIKLQDIRFRLVKALNFWNDIFDKFRGHGLKDYVEDTPENPEINYSRNYIHGVNELGKLMKKVKNILPEVLLPSLVIQAKGDPIVKPESGDIIYDHIHSKNKTLYKPDLNHHVIVRGDEVEKQVFEPIMQFIDSLTQG